MLAWRLLWRNWRSGEVKILASALMLAVAVVTAISVFTDRLEQALVKESSRFLGADRLINSSYPFNPEWFVMPEQFGVQQTQIVNFASMVFAADEMSLSSVKAVADGYPLLGEVEVSEIMFASDPADIEIAKSIPARGEVWVDSRLLPLLQIDLGDQIQVGAQPFKVSKLVIDEPDRGGNFQSMMGPRVLMNLADLESTRVVQPGSQVEYQWLIAGDRGDLKNFMEWLRPELTEHQRVISLEMTQQGLAQTLDRGQSYLLLAGIIGVLLAGVAIAIAAQRFANRHIDQVALMKSLGANANRVRFLYFAQLFMLAGLAAVAGIVVGEIIQRLIASALSSLFPVTLAGASFMAYFIGVLTGYVCLLFFALPPLWHLPTIPPLKILRRELTTPPLHAWAQGCLGITAVLLLIYFYSGNLLLTFVLFLSMGCLVVVAAIVATVMLKVGRQLGMRAGSVWRLALASLQRNGGQSTVQILVFATAIMLLLSITTLRSTLVEEWQMQMPENAPNHFFMNIPAEDVEAIDRVFADEGVTDVNLFPMIRARVTHINDTSIDDLPRRGTWALRREANLSFSDQLPADNKLTEGRWWDDIEAAEQKFVETKVAGVSLEQSFAEEANLKVGDKLRFSIAGLGLDAEVQSIRSLEWESMRPNFYFLLSPGSLDGFAPTYMTGAFIPQAKKPLLATLLREHPTMMVIEVDKVMNQIRTIMDQVTSGVELVLWLVFGGGFLVLLAAVNSSMETRLQESGLLRALGSRRQLVLGSVWTEFSVLGLFAGLLAVLGSEVLLMGLQRWVLQVPMRPHIEVWVVGTLVGTLVIGALGVISCRRVVTAPPGIVLREISA
jgi:putative ABC transport system permease protein